MNKPDTKAKAKRKRHKQNKKKPKPNQNIAPNSTAAADDTIAANALPEGEFNIGKLVASGQAGGDHETVDRQRIDSLLGHRAATH